MTKIIFLHLVMGHLLMGCIVTGPLFQSAPTQYTLVGKEEKKGEERAQYLVGGFGTGALPLTHLGILMVFVYWVTRKAASLGWDSTSESQEAIQWRTQSPFSWAPFIHIYSCLTCLHSLSDHQLESRAGEECHKPVVLVGFGFINSDLLEKCISFDRQLLVS